MSNVGSRDYELDEEIVAAEPAQLKAIADPLRSEICDLVLERAMSVTELADRVGRPKGTVAYHVEVLVDAGMLRVVRTRRVRAVQERLYGRVARTIVIPHHGEHRLPFVDQVVAEADAERLGRDDVPAISTLRHARIPADRAHDYRRRLLALALEFIDEPRDGDIEFGLFLSLYPTRRSADEAATISAGDDR